MMKIVLLAILALIGFINFADASKSSIKNLVANKLMAEEETMQLGKLGESCNYRLKTNSCMAGLVCVDMVKIKNHRKHVANLRCVKA